MIMASWFRIAGGGLATLVLTAGLGLSACSPRQGSEDQANAQGNPHGHDATPTALSSFLAGRLAQQAGDTKAAADYYIQALMLDPDNTELLERAFTLMVTEGRFEEAVPLARILTTFDSDAAIPLLVLGVEAARQGDFAQAESHFAALPKRGFNAFLSPLLAAWSHTGAAKGKEGGVDEAIAMLAPLAQAQGLAPLHAFHAGLINDLAGRAEQADTHYKVALAGQLAIRTVEAAGTFYQRSGKVDSARDLYARYAAEHPDTLLFDGSRLLQGGEQVPRLVGDSAAGLAQALFDTASLMRQGNAVDLALVFARMALAVQPDFGLAQMFVADILSSQNRLAEANEAYGAIPAEAAAHAYGALRIAVNLDEMGDTEAALAALGRLAQERPDALDALVTKADLLRKHKRFAEAAQVYSSAIDRIGQPSERHWLLFFSRGIAYERAKDWPKAEADFQKSLELRPDQPDVLNYLGYSWVDQGINLDQGKAMIEKAVELRPRDGAIVDSLGWALYRMGDYVGAVKQLERAVELRPEDPTINDHLGDAYWQVGRVHEAMFQWRRALTLDPEPVALDALKEKVRTGDLPAIPLEK